MQTRGKRSTQTHEESLQHASGYSLRKREKKGDDAEDSDPSPQARKTPAGRGASKTSAWTVPAALRSHGAKRQRNEAAAGGGQVRSSQFQPAKRVISRASPNTAVPERRKPQSEPAFELLLRAAETQQALQTLPEPRRSTRHGRSTTSKAPEESAPETGPSAASQEASAERQHTSAQEPGDNLETPTENTSDSLNYAKTVPAASEQNENVLNAPAPAAADQDRPADEGPVEHPAKSVGVTSGSLNIADAAPATSKRREQVCKSAYTDKWTNAGHSQN